MNEMLKTFTEDLAKELKAKLQSSDTADFIATVKASGDDRTFEVVMSTADEDRQGDSLDQANWDLKYFDMNPVVLWAHNYQGFPIGIVTDIVIQGDKAIATGKFAPAGINPEADMACALYQAKILRAVSPGYIQNDDGTRELLELSFCPVPAGKYALSLRQVRALGVSTRELITKGFFFDEKAVEVAKTDQIGDSCEQDDGSPGVLAEGDSPGVLICVPTEDKAEKSNDPEMKNKLTDNLKAEHGRHSKAVAEAVDGLSDKDKSIDEFEKSIEDEQADHLDKCMKAIDENYELDEQHKSIKSIDDFKKSITGEHLAHVKNIDKAIDEYKAASEDVDDEEHQKAIDEFTKSVGDELDRHEKASIDLAKAEMGEGEEDEEKSVEEKEASYFAPFVSVAVKSALDFITEKKSITEDEIAEIAQKAGRTISAATSEKIKAIIKSLEDHNAEHTASTTTAIASLKELSGSPQEGDGEEQKSETTPAPKKRSSPPEVVENKDASTLSEFETYLFTRQLLKAVYQASGNGLAEVKKALREKYPDRR